MDRVAIYARCSAQKQADKDLSIPAQLDAARAHAAARGWEVAREYVDEAESARTADRPDFQRMIGDARRKPQPFDVIIVWKFSRFARSREDSVIYKRLLEKHGVRLLSLNEPVDDGPAGRMLEGILEVLDEFYSRNLATDTVRGMRKNASLGFHNGGVTPTGYRVERRGDERSPRGILVPDPEYAPIIARIARDYLGGQGAKAIAMVLNDEGLRTRRSKLWSTQAVLSILRNETYAGVRSWGKKAKGGRHKPDADPVRVVGAHEALVEPEDFARIQVLLASRSRERVHPRRLSSDYLLSGLLVCGACGAKYIGHSAKSGQVHYYGCQRKMKSGASACTGRLLNRDRAEAAVAAQLRDVVLTPVHFGDLVRMVNEELAGQTEAAALELETVQGQLVESQGKLARLYDAIESGALSIADLAPRIRQRKEQVDELLAARSRLLSRPDGVPVLQVGEAEVEAHVAGLRALLASGSVGKRRAFLTAWVRRIEVHGTDLKIVYSFPWLPEGGEAANDPMEPGVVSIECGRRKGKGGPRTTQAEPSECRVLPMVVNGSPVRARP
jgi:DNA invertase Pin-like site-specific DNA recombinase